MFAVLKALWTASAEAAVFGHSPGVAAWKDSSSIYMPPPCTLYESEALPEWGVSSRVAWRKIACRPSLGSVCEGIGGQGIGRQLLLCATECRCMGSSPSRIRGSRLLTSPPCRDLAHSDSDSSIPQLSDFPRAAVSMPRLRPALLNKPAEEQQQHQMEPFESEKGSREGLTMKKVPPLNHHGGLEKAGSLGELGPVGARSGDSSRSHSPSSTEPDTPSPPANGRTALSLLSGKANSRIPHLAAKKTGAAGEEDSGSTGEETDSGPGKKKFPLKIFKKPRK